MSGGKVNWVTVGQRKRADKERTEREYSSNTAAVHARSIAAKKVIHQSLNHMKPFHTWTDYELGQLGNIIKREWVRRRKPVIFKEGKRIGYSVHQKIRIRHEEMSEKSQSYTRDYINHLDGPKRIETKRY